MNGIINVLKPPGMTSNNVVSDIRRMLQIKKVGHTGTLDPGAAGVLPICLGKATRLFDVFVDKEKEYICEICFGKATDTLDAYGVVTEENSSVILIDQVRSVLPRFLGKQVQNPPMYSAIKVNGQKLYQLARNGETFDCEKKARQISIPELELMEQTGINTFLLRIVCSRGTYVRVLCEDIAKELDTVAYMSFLIRSKSGNFLLENSWTLDEVMQSVEDNSIQNCVISMQEALKQFPVFVVPDRLYRLLFNGVPLQIDQPETVLEDQMVQVFCQNEFFGLGNWTADCLRVHTFLHA